MHMFSRRQAAHQPWARCWHLKDCLVCLQGLAGSPSGSLMALYPFAHFLATPCLSAWPYSIIWAAKKTSPNLKLIQPISEYCFTSRSAQSWRYIRNPKAGPCLTLNIAWLPSFFYSALFHKQHCTMQAFEKFEALYMYNPDESLNIVEKTKNKRRWPNVDLMLGQCRRQWANGKSTSGQRYISIGSTSCIFCIAKQVQYSLWYRVLTVELIII